MKNILENLELKLAQTKIENAEKLEKIESELKKNYSDFFDFALKKDNLGFKRFISVSFQLDKLDHKEKNDLDIFKNSIEKALKILTINKKNKEKLEKKLINILKIKEQKNLKEIFKKTKSLDKDKNYPILEDLQKHGVLDENDLLKIRLKYKETHNILDSIGGLSSFKIEIIKHNFFELNNTKSEDRIENFKRDYNSEIKNSKFLQTYPKIIKFIGKNYFKLRLKNKKLESKKDRLKRLYKIAFLKLYRLKYSGIDIEKILNKIDNLSDFDDFVALVIKYFEVLKQNPNLQKDYIVSEEVEEVENIINEAEDNKEKIFSSEKNTIKVNEILEKYDRKLTTKDLEDLLSEDVDLVGQEFVNRKKEEVVQNEEQKKAGIYADNFLEDREDDDEKLDEEVDIEKYYEKLKEEYLEIEEKKKKLFLEGKYEELDDINEDLLQLTKKLEKLEKLF